MRERARLRAEKWERKEWSEVEKRRRQNQKPKVTDKSIQREERESERKRRGQMGESFLA